MALPQLKQRKQLELSALSFGPASPLADIFLRAELQDDLAAVERRIHQRTASRSPLLAAAGEHTVAAGGKRLRAALVLLAAKLGDYDLERAIHPAAAVELMHAASLVHDDLVDHTLQRRGKITVHARWDNHVALMLGDYFFALASGELASEPDPRIIAFYADAARTIVEGELHPVTQLVPTDVALKQYFRKIGAKTAALFEAACKAGIAVAGGSEEEIEALGRFGYDLGVAFQIVDDVLDFTGDEVVLGKPAGNDLREGTLTSPLIYAVAQSNDPFLREVARTAQPNPAQVPEIVRAVIESGGIDRAMNDAYRTADQAMSHLAGFPASRAKQACHDVIQFVLTRQT